MSSSEASRALKLSLLGENIQKTRLPRLMAALCEREGLTLEFDLSDSALTPGFDFDRRADECAAGGYAGIVVTHPFKTLAIRRAARTNGIPDGLGASNSLKFTADGWIAANTDHSGFLKAWAADMGAAKPGRVVMAGAGGVARSLAFAMMTLGAETLGIYDIDPERASAVARACDPTGRRARTFDAGEFRAATAEATGLINATPLGMAQYPGMAFDEAAIGGQDWVFDAVYTPIETPFMQAALAKGLTRLTGFDLFLNMGLDLFGFFSGTETDRAAAMPQLRQLAPTD